MAAANVRIAIGRLGRQGPRRITGFEQEFLVSIQSLSASCYFVTLQTLGEITKNVPSVEISNGRSEANKNKNRYPDKIPCKSMRDRKFRIQ